MKCLLEEDCETDETGDVVRKVCSILTNAVITRSGRVVDSEALKDGGVDIEMIEVQPVMDRLEESTMSRKDEMQRHMLRQTIGKKREIEEVEEMVELTSGPRQAWEYIPLASQMTIISSPILFLMNAIDLLLLFY